MKKRTQKEIVDHISAITEEDFFGVMINDCLIYLDFEHAKPMLEDEVTKEKWEEDCHEYTLENVIAEMKDYLEFAIGKAEDERGLSANRSIQHYQAWFWLIGEDEISKNVFDNYRDYGMPKLREIETWLQDK